MCLVRCYSFVNFFYVNKMKVKFILIFRATQECQLNVFNVKQVVPAVYFKLLSPIYQLVLCAVFVVYKMYSKHFSNNG